jgi:hypothetical protein
VKHVLINLMKKLLTAASSSLGLFLASVSPALADLDFSVRRARGTINADTSPGAIITFVVAFIIIIAVLAALIMIVIGALQWITSGGDKTKVDSARNHIISAIIGLVVIALSFVIINVVMQALGIGSLTDIKLQTLPEISGLRN